MSLIQYPMMQTRDLDPGMKDGSFYTLSLKDKKIIINKYHFDYIQGFMGTETGYQFPVFRMKSRQILNHKLRVTREDNYGAGLFVFFDPRSDFSSFILKDKYIACRVLNYMFELWDSVCGPDETLAQIDFNYLLFAAYRRIRFNGILLSKYKRDIINKTPQKLPSVFKDHYEIFNP